MVTDLTQEKEAILEHIKLCPTCGADLETWEEQLHEKHHCQPEPKVRKCFLCGHEDTGVNHRMILWLGRTGDTEVYACADYKAYMTRAGW